MMDLTVARVLWSSPWASAAEIAARSGRSVPQVNRDLEHLQKQGLAACIEAGRRVRPCPRWILSSLGIDEFSRHFLHIHGVTPWWITETGVWSLFQRLEQLEQIYAVAPVLFQGEGAQWDVFGRELKLVRLGFFRHGQLVEAWGDYEGDITIYFCWVGMEAKLPAIRRKWERRLDRLMWREKGGPESLLDPQDPISDEPPDPSGYAVIGADRCALGMAAKELPDLTPNCVAWCWVDGKTSQVQQYEEKVSPTHRYAEDYGRMPEVGRPEHVIGKAAGLAVMSGVTRTKIFEFVEEWYALRVSDLAKLCGAAPSDVRAILREFVDAELVVKVETSYYLGPAGFRYAGLRDRVSPAVPRSRHTAYLNENMARHRHQLRHNRMVNRIVLAEHAAGGKIYGGWRGVVILPDRTQVVPDALLVGRGPFGYQIHRLEAERTAVDPDRIRDKILPHTKALDYGELMPVVFVVERAEVERMYIAYGRHLNLLTTLLADVERGPVEGEETVWRYRGKPAPFVSL